MVYDVEGLPDCKQSVSDEVFCSTNWATPFFGHPDSYDRWYHVPEWLIPYHGEVSSLSLSTKFQQGSEFHCADSPQEAVELFAELSPLTAETATEVLTRDPRWYDIVYDETEVAHGILRMPRCSYFADFENLTILVPPLDAEAWQVAQLPADRPAFFDIARTIEIQRYTWSSGYDSSLLYAAGSTGGQARWTFRTCRIVGQPVRDVETNQYTHGIWQTDYTMDAATGKVRLTIEEVRTVACDDWLVSAPM